MSSDNEIGFESSKLGTKEYWDSFYKLEHNNFKDNKEDIGECWFDASNAENNMCDYIFNELSNIIIKEDVKICDLGTGNGHLLFQLFEDGLKGNLIGVDYSETSVEFAKDIAVENNYHVNFFKSDILNPKDSFLIDNVNSFDIILDKGTFDAISLNGEKLHDDKLGVQIYPDTVATLLKKDSILLITSCNFTETELTNHLTKNGQLKVFGKVDYPVLEFAGHKGSTICTVAFQKL
mgnify:FL=1